MNLEQTLRNQALEYATRLGDGYSPDEVLNAAERYYAFLTKTQPKAE